MLSEWLKKVGFCMIFLELIYQLLPGKTWQKYLKLTGGLIFMLVLMEPILQVCSLTEDLDSRTWNWQIRQSSAQLLEEQKELAELQNEQIQQRLSRELEQQVAWEVSAYGGEPEQVHVYLKDTGDVQIDKVEIILKENMEKESACRAGLQAYLGLKESQIIIRMPQEGRETS